MELAIYRFDQLEGPHWLRRLSRIPLKRLPQQTVTVRNGWLVADVLEAGGATGYNDFCLVTPEIESNPSKGESSAIAASWNLMGLDADGVAYYQSGDRVRWVDFVRAAQAGLYRGDTSRILILPGGAAGGFLADALWEAILWLFQNHDAVASTAEDIKVMGGAAAGSVIWISGARKRQIARQWRKRGFTGPRIREYLSRQPQWDLSDIAGQLAITPGEAKLMLSNAGFVEGEFGLWLPGDTADATERELGLNDIADRAINDPDSADAWSDDFPLPDDEEPRAE